MWLFTKYGFFSVVCKDMASRRRIRQKDSRVTKSLLMVRSRDRQHLVNLQNRFPGSLGDLEITQNTGTDYPYRLLVHKRMWAEAVAVLTDEIEYPNFKDEVGKSIRKDRDEYVYCLHSIWSLLYNVYSSFRPPYPPVDRQQSPRARFRGQKTEKGGRA